VRSGECEKRLSCRQRRGRIISGNFEPAQEEMVRGDRRNMLSLVSFPDRLIDEPSGVVRLPHQPPQQRQEGRRGDASVGAEKTTSVNVPLRQMIRHRPLQVEPRERKLALEQTGQPDRTVRRSRVRRAPRDFRLAQEYVCLLASQVEIAANEARYPLRMADDVSFDTVAGQRGKFTNSRIGGVGFGGCKAFRPHHRMTVVGVQLQEST
jgi:hypothetical protein